MQLSSQSMQSNIKAILHVNISSITAINIVKITNGLKKNTRFFLCVIKPLFSTMDSIKYESFYIFLGLIFYYQLPTLTSHKCFLWFKMIDISLISLNTYQALFFPTTYQNFVTIYQFLRGLQLKLQDFDVDLQKLSYYNFYYTNYY